MNRLKNPVILKKTAHFCALLCVLFCAVSFSCAAQNTKNANPRAAQTAQTVQTERGEVYRYTLTNGIPVYIKPSSNSNIEGIGIAVSGGTAYLTPEQSGLESMIFGMMTQSSAKYSLKKRQVIQYEKMAKIASYSIRGGSVLYLTCLSHYFDDMLPILVDGFLKPSFKNDECEVALMNARRYIQSIMNDPAELLFYTAESAGYKGHPYETQSDVTPESVDNITKEAMKAYHKTLLDARRISIVVVGNTDKDALVKKLNKLLGKIPALDTPLRKTEVPPLTAKGEPLTVTHPSASGTAFIARAFALPANYDDEFEATWLASSMFSETLFNIVRTKYGACYSPSSQVMGSAASYGYEFLYRVSDFENFASYMKEAREIMAQGKLIDSVTADGSYKLVPIEARLNAFKNSTINEFYQYSQTSADILDDLTRSILKYDDIGEVYAFEPKIRAVTVGDIKTVFQKYWIDGSSRWFAVAGPDEAAKLRFE